MSQVPNKSLSKQSKTITFAGASFLTACFIIALSLFIHTQSLFTDAQKPEVAGVETAKQIDVFTDDTKGISTAQDQSLTSGAPTIAPTLPPIPDLFTELTTRGIIANFRDTNISIVWITPAPRKSTLKFGVSATSLVKTWPDDRTTKPSMIHIVTINTIIPETTYYYTGTSPVIDSITIPPRLENAPRKIAIEGTVLGGAGECLVHAVISRDKQGTTPLIALVSHNTWTLDLSAVRDSALTDSFAPTATDKLVLDGLCIDQKQHIFFGSTTSTVGAAQNTSPEIALTQIR